MMTCTSAGDRPPLNPFKTLLTVSLLAKLLVAAWSCRPHHSPAVLTHREGPVITEIKALPATSHAASCCQWQQRRHLQHSCHLASQEKALFYLYKSHTNVIVCNSLNETSMLFLKKTMHELASLPETCRNYGGQVCMGTSGPCLYVVALLRVKLASETWLLCCQSTNHVFLLLIYAFIYTTVIVLGLCGWAERTNCEEKEQTCGEVLPQPRLIQPHQL